MDSVPPPQQDNAAVHGIETSHQDTAVLPHMDAIPLPQQDTILGVSDVGAQSQQESATASHIGAQT